MSTGGQGSIQAVLKRLQLPWNALGCEEDDRDEEPDIDFPSRRLCHVPRHSSSSHNFGGPPFMALYFGPHDPPRPESAGREAGHWRCRSLSLNLGLSLYHLLGSEVLLEYAASDISSLDMSSKMSSVTFVNSLKANYSRALKLQLSSASNILLLLRQVSEMASLHCLQNTESSSHRLWQLLLLGVGAHAKEGFRSLIEASPDPALAPGGHCLAPGSACWTTSARAVEWSSYSPAA